MLKNLIKSAFALVLGATVFTSCLKGDYSRYTYSFNPTVAYAVRLDTINRNGKVLYPHRIVLASNETDSLGFLAGAGSMASLLVLGNDPDGIMAGTYTVIEKEADFDYLKFLPGYTTSEGLGGTFWEIKNDSYPYFWGIYEGTITVSALDGGKLSISAALACDNCSFSTRYEGEFKIYDTFPTEEEDE